MPNIRHLQRCASEGLCKLDLHSILQKASEEQSSELKYNFMTVLSCIYFHSINIKHKLVI